MLLGRESLMGCDDNRHIYELNLDIWRPHLTEKQVEAPSMKALSGDTQISRRVTLCCIGRRNAASVLTLLRQSPQGSDPLPAI